MSSRMFGCKNTSEKVIILPSCTELSNMSSDRRMLSIRLQNFSNSLRPTTSPEELEPNCLIASHSRMIAEETFPARRGNLALTMENNSSDEGVGTTTSENHWDPKNVGGMKAPSLAG